MASDDELHRNERLVEVRLTKWMMMAELCRKAINAPRLSDRVEITHRAVCLMSPEEREEVGVKADSKWFVAAFVTAKKCEVYPQALQASESEAEKRFENGMLERLHEIEKEVSEILHRVLERFVERQKLLRHIKDIADATSI